MIFDIHGEYAQATTELRGIVLKAGKDFTVRLDSLSEREFMEIVAPYLLTEFQRVIAARAFIRFKYVARRALVPPEPYALLGVVGSMRLPRSASYIGTASV